MRMWTMIGGLVLGLFVFGMLSAQSAERITIAGSSTVKPVVLDASESFKKSNPGVTFIIGGGGSGNGVKSAGGGKVMIGMASRKVKAKESAAFPDLKAIPLGMDGVAVILHKDNPVNALTKEEIRKLFTGQIGNWKDVGGKDIPVELVGILLKHGTADVFMKYAGIEGKEQGEGTKKSIVYSAGGKSGSPAHGADGNRPACAGVMTRPGAIGFASIGVAESLAEKGAKIKLVDVDGAAPTTANVKVGKYPISRPLQVLTKGDASGIAKKFIDYLLGPEGQKIVVEKGYIAVGE